VPIRLDTAANSYATTVGVSSAQEPGLKLVHPGNPANSYLLQKLKGTHGNGTAQMPQGADPLGSEPGDPIDTIEKWIDSGASAN
jgi:hypothetical protein